MKLFVDRPPHGGRDAVLKHHVTSALELLLLLASSCIILVGILLGLLIGIFGH